MNSRTSYRLSLLFHLIVTNATNSHRRFESWASWKPKPKPRHGRREPEMEIRLERPSSPGVVSGQAYRAPEAADDEVTDTGVMALPGHEDKRRRMEERLTVDRNQTGAPGPLVVRVDEETAVRLGPIHQLDFYRKAGHACDKTHIAHTATQSSLLVTHTCNRRRSFTAAVFRPRLMGHTHGLLTVVNSHLSRDTNVYKHCS